MGVLVIEHPRGDITMKEVVCFVLIPSKLLILILREEVKEIKGLMVLAYLMVQREINLNMKHRIGGIKIVILAYVVNWICNIK